MKKIAALLLACMMLLGAAFALAETPLSGGWEVPEDTGITEESRAVFDRATEGLLGVDYEPIACIGRQIVAGTNHCFLCRATVVYPGAGPTLALVYIYEDLEGHASITNIADFDVADYSAPAEELAE